MDLDFATMGLSAVKVLLIGLAFGAGLPLLFAAGMRLRAAGTGQVEDATGTVTGRRNAGALGLSYVLFAVVIAAVVLGVLFVTRASLHHYFDISLFGA